MKKKHFIIPLVIILIVLLGIQFGGQYLAPIIGRNIYIIEPKPGKLGSLAFEYIDEMGIYTNEKEWLDNREDFSKELENVKTKEELKNKLKEVIAVGGGKHSNIVSMDEFNEIVKENTNPTVILEDNILKIKIPPFLHVDGAKEYANIIGNSINKNVKGVIIDLRDNTGGNMGPMVAGISPLIPDGEILYFIQKNGNKSPVILENGNIKGGGSPVEIENKEKYLDLPIGILINDMTASSGEFTLMSFIGLENVKIFGTPTAGYTTGNMNFSLTKDLLIVLSAAESEARNGNIYRDDPINPDIYTETPMEDAENWVKENI